MKTTRRFPRNLYMTPWNAKSMTAKSMAPVLRSLCMLTILCMVLSCNRHSESAKSYTIAVIPQGSTHEYWKSIHAGAVKAAQELKSQGVEVKIIWKAPLREDDREQQTQVVEGFISQNVNG